MSRTTERRPASLLHHTLWLLHKDLAVEYRTREIIYTMIVFAVLVVLVFAFALVRDGHASPDVAAAVLWIATALSGTLGIGRALDRERERETFRALLLAPIPRTAIYLSKWLSIVLFMLVAEALIVPLVWLFFDVPLGPRLGMVVALLGLGTLGFAAVGALFAATLMQARSRDLLLAIVLYPLTVPVIVAGVLGTAALTQTPPVDARAWTWLKILVSFDVVFVTLALWAFEPLVTE